MGDTVSRGDGIAFFCKFDIFRRIYRDLHTRSTIMTRTATDRTPLHSAREQPFARKISALKPLSSDARAQQVTDVVDAFRRLRGSVARFIRMFSAAHAEAMPDDALSAMGLRELLSMLEHEARTARFTRLPELERAIGHARRLERTRDDVFSDAFSNDPAAMRRAVIALERVDVLFVGLCVESVIARHAPASASASVPPAAPAVVPQPIDRSTALC
ncbi:hypothetical protein QZM59_33425 [Burkholderia cenocepacia]|nr:hypothetical protein [Burkholderia cenocepacia]MDN7645884.1 hypothetical protein [Burkholderia cenocepacia]